MAEQQIIVNTGRSKEEPQRDSLKTKTKEFGPEGCGATAQIIMKSEDGAFSCKTSWTNSPPIDVTKEYRAWIMECITKFFEDNRINKDKLPVAL